MKGNMSLSDKRKQAQHLLERRKAVTGDILRKAGHRRDCQEERHQLQKQLRAKDGRDPQTEARIAELEKEMDQLHTEITQLGDEIAADAKRLHELRPRRHRISQRYKKVKRAIRRAVRGRSGPDAAIRAAEKDDGKHEEPAGSNWGPYVGKIITWLGYTGPVYWCGCATAWWTLRKAGGEYVAKIRRGYAGYIEADARAGVNGLKLASAPVKGGPVSLWNNTHIVTATGRVSNGMFECWGGNTSRGDGSLSNGGEVAPRWFPLSDADCFAAQTY